MDLLPSAEQMQIVEAFRAVLSAELPLGRFAAPDGAAAEDTHRWPVLADLGCFAVGLDEEHGGAGFGLAEELLLGIEAGRQLVSPALLATQLAARAAVRAGCHALAARIVAGRCPVAFALPADPRGYDATPIAGRFRVLGCASAADSALLLCTPQGSAVLASERLPPLAMRPCVDETLVLGECALDGLAPELFVPAVTEDLYLRGMLLGAAMSVGLAQRAQELSVAHASERRQFGQPIGSFQAVKHACADMALRSEAALSLLTQAALGLADGAAHAAFDARAARLLATEAAIGNAGQAIQIHGAMGFTREMPVHVLLKRAHVLGCLFGERRELLEELAAMPTPA